MDGHKRLSGAAYRKVKHLEQAKNKAVLDKCRNIEDLFKAKPHNNQINLSEVFMPIVSINTEENTIYNQQTSAEVSCLCTNPSEDNSVQLAVGGAPYKDIIFLDLILLFG
eukprot:XP_016659861.1 PREDICTED: uncharacterized protein LOC107883743 [Acyrthosiphon pisum]